MRTALRVLFLLCAIAGAIALRTTLATSTECDDLARGGPDWLDGELHLDDFEAMISECRKRLSTMGSEELSKLSKTVFVHIGKAAGGSVKKALEDAEPNLRFDTVHVRTVQGCSPDRQRNWIFAVRDPVDRAVSAFNWRSPNNGKYGPDITYSKFEELFYECFETANSFAEALNDEDMCGYRARKILGKMGIAESLHLSMGLAFYMDHDLDCILQQKVYLVRAETFASDIKAVFKLLGLRAGSNPSSQHETHSNYRMKNETHLSGEGFWNLKLALSNEYRILQQLEQAAVNGKLSA